MNYEIPWPNMRKIRADQLTAMVMHQIGDLIPADENDTHRRVARAITELFYTVGAEVVTDIQRAEAGSPLRDHQGYTAKELQILEHVKMEAMLRPFPTVIMPIQPHT